MKRYSDVYEVKIDVSGKTLIVLPFSVSVLQTFDLPSLVSWFFFFLSFQIILVRNIIR